MQKWMQPSANRAMATKSRIYTKSHRSLTGAQKEKTAGERGLTVAAGASLTAGKPGVEEQSGSPGPNDRLARSSSTM